MNLYRKIYQKALEVNSKLQLRNKDIVFSSYPRVGSNWLRSILTEIICICNNVPFKTPIQSQLSYKVIPSQEKIQIAKLSFPKFPKSLYLPYKFVKTHLAYENNFKRILYVHRNAADTLCSYFHYSHRKLPMEVKLKLDINKFCLEKVNDYISHIRGYFDAFRMLRASGIITSFEKLIIDPVSTISIICNFLGIDVNDDPINRSLDDHKFVRYGSHIPKGWNIQFVRKGKIGSAQEELEPETVYLLNDRVKHLFVNLTYDERGFYKDLYNFPPVIE